MRWVKGHCTPPIGKPAKNSWQVNLALRGHGHGSGVGQGFAESTFFLEFAYFEDFAAVEALYILRIVIFSDQLRSPVLAGRIGC
jgi:hypothetical protein